MQQTLIKILTSIVLLLIGNSLSAQINVNDTLVKTKAEIIEYKVDKKATFPGGNQNINPFVASNIVYPVAAIEGGIEGRVLVIFSILEDGSIANIKVQKPIHPLLDEAAIAVVKKMPQWEPAEYKGKPVNTLYTLPINFILQ